MSGDRLPSGIEGLDIILNGGLRPGNIFLVEGVPGAGKTTFGLQFVYAGAVEYGQRGLIITFEEFPEQIERDARAFGWDLRKLQEKGQIAIISTSPDSLMRMMQEPGGPIDQLANSGMLQRVLVDSISHFQLSTADPAELRQQVASFLNGLRRLGVTALLTKEIERDDPASIPFEEYLVDGVIRLTNTPLGPLRRTRAVEVTKSRGQPHLSGRSGFRFGPKGIEVFPRLSSNWAARAHWLPETEGALREEHGTTTLEAAMPGSASPAPTPIDRVSMGVSGIDNMLQGGLIRGTCALIAGTSGTGKTLICLQFLYAGLLRGECGVMLTVEENASKLVQAAAAIGMDFNPFLQSGLLQLESCSPADTTSGEALWRLYRIVRERNARRVVIDSLSALFGAEFAAPGVMSTATQHLTDLFETMGITAALTWEIQDLTGDLRISENGLSALVDTLILLRYVEAGSEMRRVIGIIKSRGTQHDNQLREFHITPEGLRVECKLAGLSGLLRGSARGDPKQTVEELLQPLVYIQDIAHMLERDEVPEEQVGPALQGLAQEAERVLEAVRIRFGDELPRPGGRS